MKTIKYIVESVSVNILLLLIILSLILYPNCGGSRIERISEPPTKFVPTKGSENFPFLKLHMKNGELYVLENWEISSKTSNEGSFDDPGTFYVHNGGSFVLDNVTFMSKGQSKVMSVEIHGDSEFNNCEFEGIWADSSMINVQ